MSGAGRLEMDEFGIIERFFRSRSRPRSDIALGIGDDAAVITPPAGRELVVATDVMVSGIHFPEGTEASAVGHKVLAVNLSDLAAMGARPAWATIGLTLPEVDEAWLKGFCSGFFALAERFEVALIGGDTTHGPLNVSVQLIGTAGEGGCITRRGAAEDDVIYVSGTLGDAALGLDAARGTLQAPEPDRLWLRNRLDRPDPRVVLGSRLAGRASAAIDISDGLAADLGHICNDSRVGAIVDVARIPVSEAYRRRLPAAGWAPALSFGDDYELCFTMPPGQEALVESLGGELGVALTAIGQVTAGPARLRWVYNDEPFSLHEQGYRHFE